MRAGKVAVQYCPRCKDDVQARTETRDEVFEVRGEPVAIQTTVAVCPKCGEDLFDEAIEGKNIAAAYDAYRRTHHLLTSGEIRELRERYGLSQRALAQLLGWGEVTVNRYENGALQNRAHDTVLRLIADPHNLARVLQVSETPLPQRTLDSLRQRIQVLTADPSSASLEHCLARSLAPEEPGVLNGFRPLDLPALTTMVLYLVDSVEHAFKTKITKLLWFADFLCYKVSARSLSGSIYLAGAYGPVPKGYELLFAYLAEQGLLESEEEVYFPGTAGEDVSGERLVPAAGPELDALEPIAIRCLEAVAREFRDLSAKETVKRAHKEPAYAQTYKGRKPWNPIPYTLADTLSLSLTDCER